MRKSKLILVALSGVVIGLAAFSSAAMADCANPVGTVGKIIYNADHKAMQFCDDTDWVSMAGGGGSGSGSTPTGAVMAFNLSACPSGWTEYAAAKGRFIRGVCLDGTGCNDADGVRAVGSTQTDELKSHQHTISNVGTSGGSGFGGNGSGGSRTTQNTGGAETRPVNVALLYCEKD